MFEYNTIFSIQCCCSMLHLTFFLSWSLFQSFYSVSVCISCNFLEFTKGCHFFFPIQVISSDESLVRVRAPLSREGGLRLFPVDLQLTSHMWSSAPTVVNLTVTCVLTSQSQVVVVSILRSDQSGQYGVIWVGDLMWTHLRILKH